MNTTGSLTKDVGIKSACDALVIPRPAFTGGVTETNIP
jgi:hypothetical protein